MISFADFSLLTSLQQTLAARGYEKPTEIQTKAIPLLLAGSSVVGLSETGSGKTLSYVLPVLDRIKRREVAAGGVTQEGCPRAAVIVPTRELGEQVLRVFKPFTHETRLRVRSLLGGTTLDVARRNMAGPFDILVATPGRLVQFMKDGLVTLRDVEFLVFDEADQMLDQGFLPASAHVVMACSRKLQMALFSATLSKSVQKMIEELFEGAERVESAGSHQVVPTLETVNLKVKDGDRSSLLKEVLKKGEEGGTMIFTNTREQCDRVFELMQSLGLRSVVYRGEMDKRERRANLKAFREGKVEYLISTDLGSRGLDVQAVRRILNYHLPQKLENYLHRVGRTARAGRAGQVLNFVTERDRGLLEQLDALGSSGASVRGGRSARGGKVPQFD